MDHVCMCVCVVWCFHMRFTEPLLHTVSKSRVYCKVGHIAAPRIHKWLIGNDKTSVRLLLLLSYNRSHICSIYFFITYCIFFFFRWKTLKYKYLKPIVLILALTRVFLLKKQKRASLHIRKTTTTTYSKCTHTWEMLSVLYSASFVDRFLFYIYLINSEQTFCMRF